MGEWFNGGDAKSNVSIDRIKQAEKETGRGTGDRTEEKREGTGSSSTATSSIGEGTGTGTGRGRGKTEKEKPVELALVEVPETPKQGKPKQTRKRKKKEEPKVIEQNSLNMVIGSISAVVASRPDCEHWLLTESEINTITTPLSKMMEESEMFKNIGEYSNQIALVVACTTVFLPRVIVSVQKVKEKKQREITGNSTDTNVRTGEREPKKKTYSKPVIIDKRDKADTSTNVPDIDTSKLILGSPLA